MCVICVSKAGKPQPKWRTLRAMWDTNPDGAGFMCINNGEVEICKGFMRFDLLANELEFRKFTDDDVVIYHFRISTQAGVNPFMTHPFPIVQDLPRMRTVHTRAHFGVAHNGIIKLTSNNDILYSDTALFAAQFLPSLIRKASDLKKPENKIMIEELTNNSRLAIMARTGDVLLTGKWIESNNGLLFSNCHWCYNLGDNLLKRS